MARDSSDMLACLESFGKKPIDIFLELIQFEAYELNITDSNFTKILSDTIKKKYDITIPDIILEKWIGRHFLKKDGKLLWNECREELDTYISNIKNKEKKFTEDMAKIRKDFQEYAESILSFSPTDGNVRDVFNNYFYINSCYNDACAKGDGSEKEENRRLQLVFVFRQYMRELFKKNSEDLDTIENFGIANQIRKVVVREDKDLVDKCFLKNCRISIDTPVMMKVLGYDGRELASQYREFIERIKQAGATICFFEHSFDELWGILFSFKKNIAQSFLDAKGVNQFLKAREEYKRDGKELSLDKNIVRENIEGLGCHIESYIDAEELDKNDSFQYWIFNEEKLKGIISRHYNEMSKYQSRIDKDVKSIAAISRFRATAGIKSSSSYKDGCFFLLTDNYTLVKSLGEYYQESNCSDGFQLNELIFENNILFDLWQNLFENNTFNKAFLRSKCFAFNEIDDKFKDRLYRICRQIDRYEPEKRMSEHFVVHPELEDEVYIQMLKKEKYDDEYLKTILNNTVQQNEKRWKDEIEREMYKKIEKIETEYRNIKEKERGQAIDVQELISKKINMLQKSSLNRLFFFVKKLFNKKLTEDMYYENKAKKILGIESKYQETR